MSDEESLSDGAHNEPLDGSLLDISFREEVATQKNEKPSCSECGKRFGTKSSLTRHKKSHVANTIRCSGCHQYFKTEQDKMAHVREKHTNNICHICGKGYKRPSDLNSHLKSHEPTATAKFTCPFDGCTKTFVRKTVYQDHLNKHTGQQPYECQSCPAKFMSRYLRNDHSKLCAGLATIRCDICRQSFNHRGALHHHKAANHSGETFQCGCGATYKFPGGLQRHKKSKNHE